MFKILVVDDEMDMLILLKNVLKKNNYHVDTYLDPTLIDQTKLTYYDLIILDIMMPNIDGLTFCQNIRQLVDCPIIFLTAKSTKEEIVEGLTIGGDDYITKPFNNAELLARVEAHLRRDQREKHTHLVADDIRMNLSSNSVYIHEVEIPLTKSEYEICVLLARRKGVVFSKEQIYESIFGYDGIGDASAISEHIKNIRAKFSHHDVSPIKTVWGIGYKWE